MALSKLVGWENTRDALHQAAQVIGAIRVALIDPLPNDLQYSLIPDRNALRTGPLKGHGELLMHFAPAVIEYVRDSETVFSLDIAGHSQVSLMNAVLAALNTAEVSVEPSRKKITQTDAFNLDAVQAAEYDLVLQRMFTALATVRARLSGFMTPIVLWPHHFDLSFLLFLGEGTNEYQDPHMNFGFAPEGGGFDMPYVYSYVWPQPEGLLNHTLSSPARWHKGDWQGLVIPYNELTKTKEPEPVVESALLDFHSIVINQ